MIAPKEMFVPGNRHEWTAAVRPPEGYRLNCAIGTTFSLDFTALTALLLASVDQAAGRQSWDERAHLLHAITQVGDRVRVLVNRGQIHADVRPSNKMFALFDEMIDEVVIEHGSFHPKVWVLKYSARESLDVGESETGSNETRGPIYRLICTSRNLTLASTWEAVVCVDGCVAPTGDGSSAEVGREVALFLRASTKQSALTTPLRALLKELPRVVFSLEGSKAVQSCQFFWQSPGFGHLDEQVAGGGKVALMVSPFLGASFVQSLANKFARVIVVSRQRELDANQDAILKHVPLGDLWVVKATDLGEVDAQAPSLDLHAKILFVEYPDSERRDFRTEAWIGSANASGRAWGLAECGERVNCEVMVRCRPAIRPEQFLEQFAYRDDGWNGWIEPYQPRAIEELTPEELADDLLEKAVRDAAAQTLRARLAFSGDVASMSLDSDDRAAWAAVFAHYTGVTFEVCPLAIAEDQLLRDLKQIAVSRIVFDSLAVSRLSAFILLRLTHIVTNRSMTKALKVSLNELPNDFWERRRVAFLKDNLSAKDFGLFLKCILTGAQLPEGPLALGDRHRGEALPKPDTSPTAASRRLFDDLTIEEVLHACTQDRSLIDEVDRLVKAFKQAGHVDTAFQLFWESFREAIRALSGKRAQ